MAYTFDASAKTITLPAGMVVLDLIDCWSRYKDWLLAGNASSVPAFDTVGGNIPAIPLYLFVKNGWKVVPQAANHTLRVINGIFVADDSSDPFTDPVGAYKIRINREAPGIAIGYSSTGGTAGPSAAEIAAAIRADQFTELGRLRELALLHGLDAAHPLTVTATSRSAGDVLQVISGDGTTTTTVTRQ